jgi:hypothetical protein
MRQTTCTQQNVCALLPWHSVSSPIDHLTAHDVFTRAVWLYCCHLEILQMSFPSNLNLW